MCVDIRVGLCAGMHVEVHVDRHVVYHLGTSRPCSIISPPSTKRVRERAQERRAQREARHKRGKAQDAAWPNRHLYTH